MKNIFKYGILLLGFLLLATAFYMKRMHAFCYKIIGDIHSERTWVYLGGLVRGADDEQYTNWPILDVVGKRLHCKIMIIVPKDRCNYLYNKLCWPFENKDSLHRTYEYIQLCVGNVPVEGYIGFSNGGFFLNALIQEASIEQPVILIGSAGSLHNAGAVKNKQIIFVIGKHDEYHYVYTQKLVDQMQKANLLVKVFEHDGGHEIPEDLLQKAIEATKL